MKTLELNKMGLAPMEESELQNIDGGGLGAVGKWLWEGVKAYGAEKLIDSAYNYIKKNTPDNPYSGVPNSVRGVLPVGVRL